MGKRRYELLAPVSDADSVAAAARAGADAVYFGVGEFQMRRFKGGLPEEQLPRLVSSIHLLGMKAFQTVNTVVHESQLPSLTSVLEQAASLSVDAVIVHDLAAMRAARRVGLPFHVSSMANCTNSEAAKEYVRLGASRIVLPPEVTLAEVETIRENTEAALEMFVHGRLCLSYSGKCQLSFCLDRQSAVQGTCAVPCRREYQLMDNDGRVILASGKLLSTRDLCLIERVGEMQRAGIGVFKIEGRNRDVHYVETVTRCYREALDATEEVRSSRMPDWRRELKSVQNRGYTEGYLMGESCPRIGGGRGRSKGAGC
jgi:U32 family peptidase